MSYATPDDLVAAYGRVEIARLTTPEGADLVDVVAAAAQARLDEASGLMDSYLRRRYLTPIVTPGGGPASPELRTCCCALARYSLAFAGGTEPSEQSRLARKEQIAWLDGIAAGRVTLDGAAPAGPNSFAMVQDRNPVVMGRDALGCVGGAGDLFPWR